MITATLFNAWGRVIGTQRLDNVRKVMLNPFPTWEYVIFTSSSGRPLEMFRR